MQLADLRWHWGDAYEISWVGAFRAVRRDNDLVLTVASAEELRRLIRSDYTRRPVPRRFRTSHTDRLRRHGPGALAPDPPA